MLTVAFLILRRYGLHNTYILACLDRHIPILGQYITFARGHITYHDFPLLAGNRNALPGGDILSYQDITVFALQAYISLIRADSVANDNIALPGGNVNVAFLTLGRYGFHNNYILACLDRHIPILGQYIAFVTGGRVAYYDIPLLAGN